MPGPKTLDANLSQFSITEQRKAAVDFSSPYFNVSQAVVTVKSSPAARAHTQKDLRALKLGVQVGTTGQSAAISVEGNSPVAVYNTKRRNKTRAEQRGDRRLSRRPADRVRGCRRTATGSSSVDCPPTPTMGKSLGSCWTRQVPLPGAFHRWLIHYARTGRWRAWNAGGWRRQAMRPCCLSGPPSNLTGPRPRRQRRARLHRPVPGVLVDPRRRAGGRARRRRHAVLAQAMREAAMTGWSDRGRRLFGRRRIRRACGEQSRRGPSRGQGLRPHQPTNLESRADRCGTSPPSASTRSST
jgi:hypothetical protein